MENAISEYQRWKQQGENLRIQAKQAMESRFRELLNEAARISQEYQADFGGHLKPPPQITAFRFKTAPRKAAKPGAKAAVKAAPPNSQGTVAVSAPKTVADPKVAALQKRLAQSKAKLEAAKSGGKPTRNLEDKVYEIEDELRLATQSA